MYNFFFYRVRSFTQVKNYMTLLAPISSFSFGFSVDSNLDISNVSNRMSSSYCWFTVFCHEKSSKSACDRGIVIASLREHRYHWSSNK